VLDCGTGSGALLLATLAHLPQAMGVGVERSRGALAVAEENAARTGLRERTRLLPGDWTDPGWILYLGRQFDLVLANPPYVEEGARLAPSVRHYEPHGALFAGPEGLDAYRVLIPQLPVLLAPRGVALFEIGHTQAEAVTAIAGEAGFTARLHRDLGCRPRALELSRAPSPAP
jgi:release factor glutamine methyltransferase